ncbi:hypothetical protein [Planktothricoides raciborskii]|uniref:Uncharacterized protein n=1 Tax=Planktothricoides raciborskii FACHB-1370 TaxID=2949576 RepID=A0ABR8ED94_9CYAN|nr:hypothetical protein [Planktothricoides raciborskii]MBD2544475.1 hypothetical protein [Planktothricoides raciborskii FACHB-1370]MBD2585955.1 hypothetical protein [Planktothricoides raciborskii FACHB-1261]
MAIRPYNILSNNLSAGMLRPYRYLWFTRGENCCNIYNFNPGFFAPTAETGFLFRIPQITPDTHPRNPVSLPQQPPPEPQKPGFFLAATNNS